MHIVGLRGYDLVLRASVCALQNDKLSLDLLEDSAYQLVELDEFDFFIVLHDVVKELAQLNLVQALLDDEVEARLEEFLEGRAKLFVCFDRLLELLALLLGRAKLEVLRALQSAEALLLLLH